MYEFAQSHSTFMLTHLNCIRHRILNFNQQHICTFIIKALIFIFFDGYFFTSRYKKLDTFLRWEMNHGKLDAFEKKDNIVPFAFLCIEVLNAPSACSHAPLSAHSGTRAEVASVIHCGLLCFFCMEAAMVIRFITIHLLNIILFLSLYFSLYSENSQIPFLSMILLPGSLLKSKFTSCSFASLQPW